MAMGKMEGTIMPDLALHWQVGLCKIDAGSSSGAGQYEREGGLSVLELCHSLNPRIVNSRAKISQMASKMH